MWQQALHGWPTENSVEALLHGMSHVDGVELDLRPALMEN